jgi:hypothetical protein
MKRLTATGLVLCLLATAGCRHGGTVILDEKVVELDPGDLKILYIPKAKTVRVAYSSKDNVPINAALLTRADAEEAEKANSVKGKKIVELPSQVSGELKFGPTEPRVELAAVFWCNKKATVNVKITGE